MRLGSRLLPDSWREWVREKVYDIDGIRHFYCRWLTAVEYKSTGVFYPREYDRHYLYVKNYIDHRIKELFGDDLEITKHEYSKNCVLADFYYYFTHKPTGYKGKIANHHAEIEVDILDGEWEARIGYRDWHPYLRSEIINPYINLLMLDVILLRVGQALNNSAIRFYKFEDSDKGSVKLTRCRGRYRKIVYPNTSVICEYVKYRYGETDNDLRSYLSYRWRAFQYTDKDLGLESLGDGEAYMVLFDVPDCLLAEQRVGSLVVLRDFNTHYYYSDSKYEFLLELEKYRGVRKATRKLFKDITRFVSGMDLVVDVDSHADERKNDKSDSLGVYVRTRQGLYYRRVDLELENDIDQGLYEHYYRLSETIRNRPIRLI